MFMLKIMRACGVRGKYLKTQSKGGFLRRAFEPAAVCGQINRLAALLRDLLNKFELVEVWCDRKILTTVDVY